MRLLNKYVIAMLFSTIAFVGCKEDEVEPEEEHEQEVITDVKLVFTNVDDADDVVTALAQDPDGEGVEELEIIDEINLDTSKTYNLTFEISNSLEGEDIGEEILEEADAHQIFFGFTNDAFTSPVGDGNIDNTLDFVDYQDVDSNDNPVGLETSWETGSDVTTGGTFTVRLQHQPDEKTSTSGATDGDTDFDLTFVLNIQ